MHCSLFDCHRVFESYWVSLDASFEADRWRIDSTAGLMIQTHQKYHQIVYCSSPLWHPCWNLDTIPLIHMPLSALDLLLEAALVDITVIHFLFYKTRCILARCPDCICRFRSQCHVFRKIIIGCAMLRHDSWYLPGAWWIAVSAVLLHGIHQHIFLHLADIFLRHHDMGHRSIVMNLTWFFSLMEILSKYFISSCLERLGSTSKISLCIIYHNA